MTRMSDTLPDLLTALSATVSAVPASQARDSDHQPPALLLLTDQRPAATRKRSLLAALRNRNAPRSVAPPQQEEVIPEVRASIAVARRDRKPTPATTPAAPPAPVQRPFFALHPPQRSATAAPPPPPPPAAPFHGSQRNRPAAVADLFAAQPTGGSNPYAVALLSGSDLFHGTDFSPKAAKSTSCKRWFLVNEADKYFSGNGEFLHHRSFAFAYRNRDAAAFVASRLPASLGRVRVETR